MMVELVREKDRAAIRAAEQLTNPLGPNAGVHLCERRLVQHDARRPAAVLGVNHGAAETTWLAANDHRDAEIPRSGCGIASRPSHGPASERVTVRESTSHQWSALAFGNTRQLRIARQYALPKRLRSGLRQGLREQVAQTIGLMNLIAHSPRAPGTLMSATGASAGNPSSSPRLIATA